MIFVSEAEFCFLFNIAILLVPVGNDFVFLSLCKKTHTPTVCLLRTEEIKVPRWSLVGSLNQYEKHGIEVTYFTVCILVGFTTGA